MSGPNKPKEQPMPSDADLQSIYLSGDSDEPPAQLDAAVSALAQGKKFSAATPVEASPRRPIRWLGAMASAAIVLLTVGVFLNSGINVGELQDPDFAGLDIAAKQTRGQAQSETNAKVDAEAPRGVTASRFKREQEGQIEEIVVTAQFKPQQSLADVSMSISGEELPVAAEAQLETMAVIDDGKRLKSVQASMPVAWTSTANLHPYVAYEYPAFDAQGGAVRLDSYVQAGVQQVHAISIDRSEVYVEVVVYPQPININELYQAQKSQIEALDPRKDDGRMGKLTDTFVLGQPAKQAKVTFSEGDENYQRRFYFLNVMRVGGDIGLRIVMDPRSELNHQIVGRIKVL